MAVIHKNLTGDEAIHPSRYVQSSDPGAVGAGKEWIDTTSGSTIDTGYLLKIRNGANSAWTMLLDLATALGGYLKASNNLSDLGSATTARTNLGLGTAATHASTDFDASGAASAAQTAAEAYTDAKITGLSWKQEVRAATTTAGTLASSFANGSVIDGVTLATGDRILVKNQATGSENGIYVVAASGAPTRATDADSGAELVNAACFVSEGTTLAETVWVCSNNATITVGSTSLTFVQFGAGVSNLSALSDVAITSPANGDILTYSSGASKWENAAPSSGASRATVTKTTASLANNAVENGTVTLAKSGNLYQLIVDRACRVVLYATSADRTADAARLIGTPATPGTGVLCEFAPTASGTTDCGPAIVYYNGDGSPTSSIYYAITNLSGATHTVQVQFVHLRLES